MKRIMERKERGEEGYSEEGETGKIEGGRSGEVKERTGRERE